MRGRYLFQSRENRDAKAKVLQAEGHTVRRSSISNQLLHPQYLEDYGRELSREECGFGNTIYKTHFAKLYEVEIIY